MYSFIIALHILAGFTGLLSGTIASLSKKGSVLHVRSGQFFLYGMYGVFVTSVVATILKPNLFLFFIALFSVYFAIMGKRVLRFKKKQARPENIDFILVYTMLLTCISMIVCGYLLNVLPLVLVTFGIGGSVKAVLDLRMLRRRPLDPKFWLYEHIGNMGGAYIATITAFFVVNMPKYFPMVPQAIVWILPGLIGGVLIGRTIKFYQVMFSKHLKEGVWID